MMKKAKFLLPVLFSVFGWSPILAQTEVQWLTFGQLEDALAVQPKKVFVDFYADWCAYCKKMDKVAYRDSKVVNLLNTEYYAVKMNAESLDTIVFGGDTFFNKNVGKTRQPFHDIPLLLASREGRPFSLPAMVLLDEAFQVRERVFEYRTPKQLLEILDP
ncbi:MAG: thioredoxin family protein [Bacteroidota bacterium]